jgi:hypothetical protein
VHVEPYPPIEPFAAGMLEVGDGQRVYWEGSGIRGASPRWRCMVDLAAVLHPADGAGSIRRVIGSFSSISAAVARARRTPGISAQTCLPTRPTTSSETSSCSANTLASSAGWCGEARGA